VPEWVVLRSLPDDAIAWVTAFVDAHPDGSFLGILDRAAR
jgi:hypothetical protein